jgi:hypothetical protein
VHHEQQGADIWVKIDLPIKSDVQETAKQMAVAPGLLCNVLLISGAWWVVRHGLRLQHRIDQVLASAVLAFTWCVLGLESIGTAGWIAVGPLLAWSALPFALGLVLKFARLLGAHGSDSVGEASEAWGAPAVICVSLTLWACVILFAQSLWMPVKVVSDGPIYHLYFAIRWWKAGRLFLVASPFGECAATYFPANGDLWFTWLIATWGGESLAKVGQAPFLAVAAVAAFGIARMLGASRDSALIATCWFVTVTPLLVFSFEANVDTIFVAAYLSAVYFMLRHLMGTVGVSALVVGGLAAGLALGTKPVGLVFVGPLLVVWLASWIRSRSLGEGLKRCAILAFATVLTCGFWFVRNLMVAGNPLYPLQLEWMGTVLFPGCYDRAAMNHSMYFIPLTRWRALVDILLAVVDPRLALFWVPATLGAWALRAKTRTLFDRWVWIVSGLAVLNVALYWLAVPYRTQQRFMLQAMGLAATPLARLLDRGGGWRAAGAGLLALHLLTSQPWPVALKEERIPWDLDPHIPNVVVPLLPLARLTAMSLDPVQRWPAMSGLALELAIGGCCWLVVWSLSRGDKGKPGKLSRPALAASGVAGMLILSAVGTGALGADVRQRFYPLYPDFLAGWLHLEGRCGPAGTRVAYAGTNIPYYLFGTGLRNEVRYVNVDRHRTWLLHDYQREARARGEPLWPNSRPGWDRARPDFEAWMSNLLAEQISLLVVTVVNPGEGQHNVADAARFPIERRWAETHPELFEPLYGVREGDRFIRIYGVRRSD